MSKRKNKRRLAVGKTGAAAMVRQIGFEPNSSKNAKAAYARISRRAEMMRKINNAAV